MRFLILALLLTTASQAAVAQEAAQPELPRYLEDPPEVSRPSASAIVAAYPQALLQDRLSGVGLVECRIAEDGKTTGCVILSEEPKGKGVAAASLSISQKIRYAGTTEEGSPTAGAYVMIPVIFRMPGVQYTLVPMSYHPGRHAYVTTDRASGKPVGAVPCPTASDAKAQCHLHNFAWLRTPDFGTAATHLEKLGRKTGNMTMRCQVKDDGALGRCEAMDPLTPPEAAIMGQLLSLYRAPAKSVDGTPVAGGSVLVLFDFAATDEVLQRSALKRNSTATPR